MSTIITSFLLFISILMTTNPVFALDAYLICENNKNDCLPLGKFSDEWIYAQKQSRIKLVLSSAQVITLPSKSFQIHSELDEASAASLGKIIKENVGKRIVFAQDNKPLKVAAIIGPLSEKKIDLDLNSRFDNTNKREALIFCKKLLTSCAEAIK